MSAKPKPTRLWINDFEGRLELRADFDNDRHHARYVEPPHSVEQFAEALHLLAAQVMSDPNLR